jgi:hypothetical protein
VADRTVRIGGQKDVDNVWVILETPEDCGKGVPSKGLDLGRIAGQRAAERALHARDRFIQASTGLRSGTAFGFYEQPNAGTIGIGERARARLFGNRGSRRNQERENRQQNSLSHISSSIVGREERQTTRLDNLKLDCCSFQDDGAAGALDNVMIVIAATFDTAMIPVSSVGRHPRRH